MAGQQDSKWVMNAVMVGFGAMAFFLHKIGESLDKHGYKFQVIESDVNDEDLAELFLYKPNLAVLKEDSPAGEKERAKIQQKHKLMERLNDLRKDENDHLNIDTKKDNRAWLLKNEVKDEYGNVTSTELYMYVQDRDGKRHLKKLSHETKNGKETYPIFNGMALDDIKPGVSNIPCGLLDPSRNGGIKILADKVRIKPGQQATLAHKLRRTEAVFAGAAVAVKLPALASQFTNNMTYHEASNVMNSIQSGTPFGKAILQGFNKLRGAKAPVNHQNNNDLGAGRPPLAIPKPN